MMPATLSPLAFSVLAWYGQAAPTTVVPLENSEISCEARSQYFLISGCCSLSRATVALNCGWVSSYGSVMPRLGLILDRYSAASAIWIGLFGTVIWPEHFLSYSTDQESGAVGNAFFE